MTPVHVSPFQRSHRRGGTILARVVLALTLSLGVGITDAAPSWLADVFLHPPDGAKPRGYWVWPDGNFDYSSIRSELAEFKAKGLGGVDIFDLGIQDRNEVIPPGPGFLSPEQVDGIAFALGEAKRLGLKMGLVVSSSWNAGGPWIPPELAMMNLVAWHEEVAGPLLYERKLPFPEIPQSFRKPYGVYPLHVPLDEEGLPRFRQDVAVIAYPLGADGHLPDPSRVKVLTGPLDASGVLRCEIPVGRWVVMRLVMVNFGQRLWLPSAHSQGLTMDHFNPEATRHHFRTVIDRLTARLGPLSETALERLYLASYEANAGVTWTPGLAGAFLDRNGYRLEPYLPALYGVPVVDEETTERFLHDYRRTVSELFIENLYREASRLCRAQGLQLCSEAGGPGAPLHDVPTEDLKALGAVDVMRGEFWNGRTNQLTPDGFEELQVVKPIASAAHLYDRRIVEMEAFTSFLHWQEGPDDFKVLADRAFGEGMTRVVYHTMAHNLPEAGFPGWTYQAGSHMQTHLTWWNLSMGLHEYLARCSALLQQGQFAADVAYYYGDAVPNFAKPKHLRPDLGYGYDYDDLNTEVLLRASVDEAGAIVLPSGMRYRVLRLPQGEKRMSLSVIEKLAVLLQSGATVLGEKPERTYGLRGLPDDQTRLRQLADQLWGPSPIQAPQVRELGRGRLVTGRSTRDVLAELGVSADFSLRPTELQTQIDFIHRHLADTDLYFVRNAAERPVDFEALFRIESRTPELWAPDTGSMLRPAVYRRVEGGLEMPLHLAPHGSVFVVFAAGPDNEAARSISAIHHNGRRVFPNREDGTPTVAATRLGRSTLRLEADAAGAIDLSLSDGSRRSVDLPAPPPPLEIAGPWEVRFPEGWGIEPPRQSFAALGSWTDLENPAIRGFSGTAVYARSFEIDRLPLDGQRAFLDLGEVQVVARVTLNGRDLGILSFRPHRLEITGVLRSGVNSLVIEVANNWINRLIEDDSLPRDQRRTRTNLSGPGGGRRWRDLSPQPSGLLGPVRLVFPADTLVDLSSG